MDEDDKVKLQKIIELGANINPNMSKKEFREKMYELAPEDMKQDMYEDIKKGIQDVVLIYKEQFTDNEFLILAEMFQNEAEHIINMKQKKQKQEKSCLNCDIHDLIQKENYMGRDFEQLKEKCQQCINLSAWEQLVVKMCSNCKKFTAAKTPCLINVSDDDICTKGEKWELK